MNQKAVFFAGSSPLSLLTGWYGFPFFCCALHHSTSVLEPAKQGLNPLKLWVRNKPLPFWIVVGRFILVMEKWLRHFFHVPDNLTILNVPSSCPVSAVFTVFHDWYLSFFKLWTHAPLISLLVPVLITCVCFYTDLIFLGYQYNHPKVIIFLFSFQPYKCWKFQVKIY